MESNDLRSMATLLRKKAQEIDAVKMVKCAQVMQAAEALVLLREKVRSHGR